ncbi:hypothetical protein [Geomonas propionica]|uniref:DUF1801 domain-containing protein n=1 Tax=Geomonas propionica TaxID=2798582 RepID=A0ABS0YQG3_9BACT|nr:hypothetical protein [Geomonas propionica]MBJ6799730.1 hypothetical protein [Geomonas propionica]
MSEHATAQIRWYQNRLGLLMVNEHRQRFFIFAEKLLALFAEPGRCKEIKLRDRKPGRASGYYPGQVLGVLALQGTNYTLTLYVGYPNENIPFTPETGFAPLEYLTRLQFCFPQGELETFRCAVEIMLAQGRVFEERLQAAEATPLATSHT